MARTSSAKSDSRIDTRHAAQMDHEPELKIIRLALRDFLVEVATQLE
jgi:hypothetical protein